MIEQVPDEQLTASSNYGNQEALSPVRSRFDAVHEDNYQGGWEAHFVDMDQWIQVEFLGVKTVYKVATKGRHHLRQPSTWVTKYQLKYGLTSTEADFEYVRSSTGRITTFVGNADQNSVVENEFAMVFARVIRLCPIEWQSRIALRWELYGC